MSAKGTSSANPSKGKGKRKREPVPASAFEEANKRIKLDGYHSDEQDVKENPRKGSKVWSAKEEMVLAMAVNAEKKGLKNSFDISPQGNVARKMAWRKVRGK